MNGSVNRLKIEHEDHHILSLYGSHDSSATFVDKGGSLRVLEYERLADIRYAAFNKGAESNVEVGTDDVTREKLGWDYKQTLEEGIAKTYVWISEQINAKEV